MKIFKLILLFIVGSFTALNAASQANAYVNILTQNSGLVNLGGTVFIEVTIGNTGPVSSIGVNKVRAQISVPSAIASIPATGHVLPPGWTITVNTGSAITVCNGSDVIAVGTARTILISVQGNSIGGPSTVSANLLFSSGTSCTTPGSLSGDNTADNSSTSSIQVLAGCPIAVTASAGTIACNNGTTTLTATTTGANGPVEYSLNSGPYQLVNTFTVPAGTYTVTAKEVASQTCLATAVPVIITEPLAIPEPTINITQPNCTITTGIITITSSTFGLTFSFDGSSYASYPVAGGYIVASGIHTLSAQNANNCTSPLINITVNPQPTTPAVPTVGAITQPTCAISTGSVVLGGLSSGNWIINPGAITGSGTSTTLSGLAPGTYNFTVTNDATCTSTASATVVIDPITGVPNEPTINIVHPTCTVSTGVVTITSITTGLTFSLNGGPYSAYPVGGYTLAEGTYTLSAQNAGSCISPIASFTINVQPEIPEAPVANVTDPTCTSATGIVMITSTTSGYSFSLDGGAYVAYPVGGFVVTAGSHTLSTKNGGNCTSPVTNIIVNAQPSTASSTVSAGTIACFGENTTLTVSASGGVAPYEYSLDGVTFQTANTFTVSAGSYIVSVKGMNTCTTTTTVTVTEPTVISASSTAGSIGCYGGTATLTANASGGTTPYQYSLNGGAYQAGNTFNVGAGIQSVTVRDANLCTKTTTDLTITQPAALAVISNVPWITTCGGTTLVTITATGGRSPYTGTGNYIKGPGTWAFTVTDATGCSASKNVIVEAPGCMDLEVFPNPAKNAININHSIAEAGALLQVFDIIGARVISKTVPQDAFITTIDISRLAAGPYILVYVNGKEKKSIHFEKTSH